MLSYCENGWILEYLRPLLTCVFFFQVKVEWTEQLVAKEKQKTEKILKETQNIKAVLDAERERTVQAIATSKHIGIV